MEIVCALVVVIVSLLVAILKRRQLTSRLGAWQVFIIIVHTMLSCVPSL